MKKGYGRFFFLSLLILLAVSSSSLAKEKELVVSAAASLKDSFQEIGKIFMKKHKGVKVLFNFGGSGALRLQIEAGAPVDVFASAGQKDMDLLEKKGLVMKGTRHNFVENVIVLIAPIGSKLSSFADLKTPAVQRFAMGNPKTVPSGQYGEETLKYQKLWESLQGKIVYGEDVRQVLDYVARKEVDAGIVFRTDALLRPKEVKIVAEAPNGSYTRPLYPIAVVAKTREPQLAKEFVALVLSPTGKKIFSKYGFMPVEPAKKKNG
ncbi:molybdate ABC transporter substrate-binding protein [bacterium]|nr:molybdate ABC transporter substrate-binding protein [bacterium]